MSGITNSFIVLFLAFFFEKADAEWYWWVALAVLFLIDEVSDWAKRRI